MHQVHPGDPSSIDFSPERAVSGSALPHRVFHFSKQGTLIRGFEDHDKPRTWRV